MALKFLNKKGWHTGSLRNIENVWKAEQKHDAEQRKLEELRKQIQEDHEKAQFRLLQEQAGLVPRQERLDFLYESGLAVGKGSSEGFKALQAPAAASASASAASTGEDSSSKAAVPGALFEDKPQSANDAWRKLHSDPLLLIRQREQEALARIKNNPIKMAMIKKSVEAEKNSKQEKDKLKKKRHKGHHHSKSNNGKHSSKAYSDQEDSSDSEEEKRKRHHLKSTLQDGKRVDSSKSGRRDHDNSSEDDDERRRKGDHKRSEQRADGKLKYGKHTATTHSDSEDQREERVRRKSNGDHKRSEQRADGKLKYGKHTTTTHSDSEDQREERVRRKSNHSKYESYHHHNAEEERGNRGRSVSHHHHSSYSRHGEHSPRVHLDPTHANDHDGRKGNHFASEYHLNSELDVTNKRRENERQNQQPSYNRRRGVPKMSEEERAARLKEMQADAELHEEQRWKRLKKAAENDAQEAKKASFSRGKNFLDDAQKNIYGAEKGGSVTIEESVRRRAFYSQGSSAHESNAFRR